MMAWYTANISQAGKASSTNSSRLYSIYCTAQETGETLPLFNFLINGTLIKNTQALNHVLILFWKLSHSHILLVFFNQYQGIYNIKINKFLSKKLISLNKLLTSLSTVVANPMASFCVQLTAF